MAKAAKAPAISIEEQLKAMSSKTTSKAKSSVVPLEGYEKESDALNRLLKDAKDLETQAKAKKDEMLDKIEKIYIANAKSGNYAQTYQVLGEKTDGVNLTWKDQFSEIPSENEAELRALDPNFDDHFASNRKIILKKTDDATIKMLMEALGPQFAIIFEVKMSLVAKEGMDKRQHEVPTAARVFLKQTRSTMAK